MTANAHVGHDDWNERLELAQQMIPLIHQLHRNNNVVTTIFGRPLVGQTDIDIIKSHRYGRRIAQRHLSTAETLPILVELADMNLGAASVDLGRLVLGWEESNEENLRMYLEGELCEIVGAGVDLETTDVVLYGFGRIGRLLARLLVAREAAYGGVRLRGIVLREWLRFVLQRSRFLSALVRPLLWLLVFAAGFRAALGIAIIEPYDTYITYDTYIVPGLACMILLFNGMQGSLSMVYDREMGSMRVLLTSPLPRAFLLAAKLLATALISLLQVYAFLAIAWVYGVQPPAWGLLAALPALLLVALLLSALGLLLSNGIRQLENFAGVMNFVIFPMFFLSSALYPLWKMRESSEWLYWLCAFNPFTHAVELVRNALYLRLHVEALAVCTGLTLVLTLLAVASFNPQHAALRKAG